MTNRLKALSVHLLTATGTILSMLATLAAVNAQWSLMFLWLLFALLVDGVDGPLARRYNVKSNWPSYDGVLMDLIIDYLTYVFIPALALFNSGLLNGWIGWVTIFAVIYGSVIYFSDTRMKTKDNSFSGFPACWNMVVLVIFSVQPHWMVITIVMLGLVAAMFTNLKFIHPVRTERWRSLSLPIALLWTALAANVALQDFNASTWVNWCLVQASIYLTFAGIAQQFFAKKSKNT